MTVKIKTTDEELGYVLERLGRATTDKIQKMDIKPLQHLVEDHSALHHAVFGSEDAETIGPDTKEDAPIQSADEEPVQSQDSQVFITIHNINIYSGSENA